MKNSSINQFSPIYDAVLNTLRTKEILPVNNRESFTTFANAYLSEDNKLIPLFNMLSQNGQSALATLVDNPHAVWVFTSISKNKQQDQELWHYVRKNLVQKTFDSKSIARAIKNADNFIEQQTDEWLIEFYHFLLDIPSLFEKGHSDPFLRQTPILRLEDDTVVAPFNANGDAQAFLPTPIKSSYPTIKGVWVASVRKTTPRLESLFSKTYSHRAHLLN